MKDPLRSPVESTDLATVRSRLAEERRLAKAQIFAMTAQLEEIIESSQFVATDDEHDPDGSTVAFERSKISALLAHSRERLAEVDSALERLEAGTYGVCEFCGVAIPGERLLARPVARHCVRCAVTSPERKR
jgi:RNA polymerase-binding transcription factor DksA